MDRQGEAVESDAGGVDEDLPRPLTAAEVDALRAHWRPWSPWSVVAMQVAAGLLMTLAAWLGWDAPGRWLSVAYGGASIALPTALLAHGMRRRVGVAPQAVAFSFALWEFVKIGVCVAMLLAAPRLVPDLSWPLLLVAMIVCMKVNWLALLVQGRGKTTRP